MLTFSMGGAIIQPSFSAGSLGIKGKPKEGKGIKGIKRNPKEIQRRPRLSIPLFSLYSGTTFSQHPRGELRPSPERAIRACDQGGAISMPPFPPPCEIGPLLGLLERPSEALKGPSEGAPGAHSPSTQNPQLSQGPGPSIPFVFPLFRNHFFTAS